MTSDEATIVSSEAPVHEHDDAAPASTEAAEDEGERSAPRLGQHESWLATVLMVSILAVVLGGFSVLRVGVNGDTHLQVTAAVIALGAALGCIAFAGFATYRTRDDA